MNCILYVVVTEWQGENFLPRHIDLQFDSHKCLFHVLSDQGARLRTIDFTKPYIDEAKIWLSNDKKRNTVMVHVPKEYDLVGPFPYKKLHAC